MDQSFKEEMDAKRWGELFREAYALGVSFILLAGGEPLEREDVLEEAAKTPELIFPVFTNGTLFTPAMLKRFVSDKKMSKAGLHIEAESIDRGQRKT